MTDEARRAIERQAQRSGDPIDEDRAAAERARAGLSLGIEHTLVGILGRKGAGKSTLLRAIVLRHAARGVRFHVLDSTAEWAARPGVKVYRAHEWDLQDVAEEAILDRPSVLVVDELDRWLTSSPSTMRAGDNVHSIVQYGRHLRVGLLWAARRTNRVHTDLIALSDVIYWGATSHPGDLDKVEATSGSMVADKVRGLAPGEFERHDF